jgi:glycogen operon protein
MERSLSRRSAPVLEGEVGIGALATRLAGSSDIFGEQACRSVNFLAAHDGFTLADLLAYEQRHNEANGEQNRDGHGDNHSWNHGVEGPSDDAGVQATRASDARALLATLFASTGTIMLTAGDEFGRSQQGNNNAYCQDSPIGWVDWAGRDEALEDDVALLSAWRAARAERFEQFPTGGVWINGQGEAMSVADWEAPDAGTLAYASSAYRLILDRATRRVTMSDDAAAELFPAAPTPL